jgi:hypothetical protein
MNFILFKLRVRSSANQGKDVAAEKHLDYSDTLFKRLDLEVKDLRLLKLS